MSNADDQTRYVCPHCGYSYSGCEPAYCPNTIAPAVDVEIFPHDALNPGFGYRIRIRVAGATMLDTESETFVGAWQVAGVWLSGAGHLAPRPGA
jgi:hypothetical protein